MNAIELSLMSFDLASGSFTVSLLQSDELVIRLLKIETESSQMAGLAETDMDPRIDTDLKNKAAMDFNTRFDLTIIHRRCNNS